MLIKYLSVTNYRRRHICAFYENARQPVYIIYFIVLYILIKYFLICSLKIQKQIIIWIWKYWQIIIRDFKCITFALYIHIFTHGWSLHVLFITIMTIIFTPNSLVVRRKTFHPNSTMKLMIRSKSFYYR